MRDVSGWTQRGCRTQIGTGSYTLIEGACPSNSGALTFVGSGGGGAPAGTYAIPHQSISMVLLGPGGSVTHDVLRLLARHKSSVKTACNSTPAPPLLPDTSTLARKQAGLWSDAKGGRMRVARKMYAMRLGEVLPHRDIAVLRGIEGARAKETYKIVADRFWDTLAWATIRPRSS